MEDALELQADPDGPPPDPSRRAWDPDDLDARRERLAQILGGILARRWLAERRRDGLVPTAREEAPGPRDPDDARSADHARPP